MKSFYLRNSGLLIVIVFLVIGCQHSVVSPLLEAPPDDNVTLSYNSEHAMLSVEHPLLSGEPLKIWLMEAYCKKDSTHRRWDETVIPQQNSLLSQTPHEIKIKTLIGNNQVKIIHCVTVIADEILFESTLTNLTEKSVDIEWMQPCLRVGKFTGLGQNKYIRKCFIFTGKGLLRLPDTNRTEEAVYRGGQVYVPAGINRADVNPRPVSPDVPVHNLIGCFSADEKVLLATAWNKVQELFQGVIVCIHADPAIGGLLPGQTKYLFGKLYILPNDIDELLRRYNRDFK